MWLWVPTCARCRHQRRRSLPSDSCSRKTAMTRLPQKHLVGIQTRIQKTESVSCGIGRRPEQRPAQLSVLQCCGSNNMRRPSAEAPYIVTVLCMVGAPQVVERLSNWPCAFPY